MNSKMWGISQVKSEINLGENYQINTRLNLKTRQKKAYNDRSNVLEQCSLRSRLGFLCN